MPIYENECLNKECPRYGEIFDVILPRIKQADEAFACSICGHVGKPLISVQGELDYGFKPYVTEHITGKPILLTSHAHRERLMKEHGLYLPDSSLTHRQRRLGHKEGLIQGKGHSK